MNTILHQPLSQLVADNYKAAFVLEKYGVNFCCRGKQSLQSACLDKGISPDQVLAELSVSARLHAGSAELTSLPLPELIDHIVDVHHDYIKQSLPMILNQLYKIATRHGDNFPYMKKVYVLFTQVNTELTHHMNKEESDLFPLIRQMEASVDTSYNDRSIAAMIEEMEQDHEQVRSLMHRIREITNDYQSPANACITFRVALNALKHFEADLQQHEHLEANILFPQAALM